MKICILGGTGNMGTGLTIRWALNHIIIGSRSLERAQEIATTLRRLAKGFYQSSQKGTITAMTELKRYLHEDQIVISTVVPMRRRKKLFYFTSLGFEDEEKSAARDNPGNNNPHPGGLCLPDGASGLPE